MKGILKLAFLVILTGAFGLSKASTIVCIAGGTGAGKSTIAKKLKQNLGDSAVILSQDSYYKDLSHLEVSEREKVNFDHPDSIEFELLQKHLLALKEGDSVAVPTYDFKTHTRIKKTKKVNSKPIIILEGILPLAIPEVRNLFDIKVFVDVENDVRLLRRIKRDIEERGRSIASIHNQYLSSVRPMHKMFVEPSKNQADIIIPHGGENSIAIKLLTAKLKDKIEKEIVLSDNQDLVKHLRETFPTN